MRYADRLLCHDCKSTLIASGLVFKPITDYSMPENPVCDWCRRPKALRAVRIRYGGRK